MEKIKNTPNEAAPIINNFSADDIPRCPDCNLICSLQLNYNEGKHIINFECENGHKGNILLKEYINKFNKFSLSKEKCKVCEKNKKKVKGYLFYCSKCNKFICYSCLTDHPFGDNHFIINFQKYDSLCKIHSNLYCFY